MAKAWPSIVSHLPSIGNENLTQPFSYSGWKRLTVTYQSMIAMMKTETEKERHKDDGDVNMSLRESCLHGATGCRPWSSIVLLNL